MNWFFKTLSSIININFSKLSYFEHYSPPPKKKEYTPILFYFSLYIIYSAFIGTEYIFNLLITMYSAQCTVNSAHILDLGFRKMRTK